MLVAISDTGYSNDVLCFEWIKCFGRFTTKRQLSKWRLLLLDGYGLHYTKEFLDFYGDHHIIPYCLPPHTTHLLQPLDVVCFQAYRHGTSGSPKITRRNAPNSPEVTRYDSACGARDASTLHKEPRETPLATSAPAPTATPITTATSVPRACDASTLALPHDTDAPQPNNGTAPSSYDAGVIMPLHRAAPDDSTAPSSCDTGVIMPLHQAAPNDSTAPSSCDADSIAPLRPSDRAAPDGAAPPCDIAKPKQGMEQGGEDMEPRDIGRKAGRRVRRWGVGESDGGRR